MSRACAGGYLGTFLGVPMHQLWDDLALWECVLEEAGPLRMIVELGTGTGGFSTFLLLQCMARGMGFTTVDQNQMMPENRVAQALELYLHRMVGDLWGSAGAMLEDLLGRPTVHPLLLFCDNGDKPRELRTFSGLLQPGDVLAVHDWGTEVRPEHMRDAQVWLNGTRLSVLATGMMTRFWRVEAA